MRLRHLLAIGLCWAISAVPSHGTERVEIVLDTSMGMWDTFPDGTPRIVAIRSAIDAFVVSPAASGRKLDFGLRTFGGRSDITKDSGCADSRPLLANGPVDSMQWSSALAGLEPKGGRALVHAIEEAAKDLSSGNGNNRMVVITSGADQCHRDISALLERLSAAQNPIEVRIIGLGLNQELANSLLLLAPTRNPNDPSKLLDTVRWAAAPQTSISNRGEWLELFVTRNEKPVTGATLFVADRHFGEEYSTDIVAGVARIRLPPARYRARIEGPEIGSVLLDDIYHAGTLENLSVVLSSHPPVTLEVDPERPLAGAEAYIQFWGAPAGTNFVVLTAAEDPPGKFLTKVEVGGSAGEVTLSLPDSPNDLEVQFTHDIGSGIQQRLGKLEFRTSPREVGLNAPERAEIQSPMTLSWDGVGLPGDHIVVEYRNDEVREDVLCLPVGSGGQATINAPDLTGDYVIRFRSRHGWSLARSSLEVFEILATLDSPTAVAPGEEVVVTWTGKNEAQDFLSIASHSQDGEEYLRFAPTEDGNPSILTAPATPGEYEIRYVRGADGEVLALHPLAVVVAEINLEIPSEVEAGTRFEVAWNGTSGEGDFVAVARPRSGKKRHLDWAYTDLGSPVSLAAPFEPGTYVVRYVSGTSHRIVARKLFEVR